MILAFSLGDIIQVPFGLLLKMLYQLTDNYGVAMIICMPITPTVYLPAL